jgi:hypothetical protein
MENNLPELVGRRGRCSSLNRLSEVYIAHSNQQIDEKFIGV